MKRLLVIASLLLAALPVCAQVPANIQGATVGALPTASANTGKVYVVTDGLTAGDCAVGGGSTRVLCRSDGSTWTALGDGNTGSGNPFADSTAIIKGSGDASKLLRIEVDGFTSGQTRVVTPPDSDTKLPIADQFLTFTGPTAARTYTMPDANRTLTSTADNLSVFAATTSAQLRGVLSDEVGSGAAVFENANATLGNITVSGCTGCGGGGASDGSGTELQRTDGAGGFVKVTGSSVSGGAVTLASPLTIADNAAVISLSLTTTHTVGSYLSFNSGGSRLIGNTGSGSGVGADKFSIYGGSHVFLVDFASGVTGINQTGASAQLHVTSGSASRVTAIFQAAASDSVDKIQVQESDGTVKFAVDKDGNALIGAAGSPSANGGKVLAFGDNGSTNPTMASNTAGIFAKDVSGTVEAFAVDEAGNSTQISPHRPGTDQWYFYSCNSRTGRCVEVDMEKLVRTVESKLNVKLMKEWYEQPNLFQPPSGSVYK